MTYTVTFGNGRTVVHCENREMALRLAARTNGSVTATMFGFSFPVVED